MVAADAGVEAAAADAVVADAAVDAMRFSSYKDPCDPVNADPKNVPCNPPSPSHPLPPVDGVIVAISAKGKEVTLTVNKGSKDGVAKTWKAELLSRSGNVLATLAVLMVKEHSTDVRYVGSFGSDKQDLHVRLSPPSQ